MDSFFKTVSTSPDVVEEEPQEVEIDSSESNTNPISEKESLTQSLEQRSLSTDENEPSITLEFGDIIEIIAPTNSDINEMTALITYIDNEKIKFINVSTLQHFKLNITEEGTFSDESITQINLLSRSEQKGYARQNNLFPRTWINIHFGGEIPAIITGEISNLEEDMIEITTYPELRTIYINFGYKGIPENLPIEKIVIRNKPATVTVPTLSMLKNELEEGEEFEDPQFLATIEYTEAGESIISIPEGVDAEKNFRDELHALYQEAATGSGIVFGEKLGEIAQLVEIPEGNQRYGIDIQVNDMMDELLSTIPDSQRTRTVLENIHMLIERYKELRQQYSKFDRNDNVYDAKIWGASHKPLMDHVEKMNKKLQWLLPVVTNRRKLYDVNVSLETSDTVIDTTGKSLREIEKKQLSYYKNNSNDQSLKYADMLNYLQNELTPFESPTAMQSNYLEKTTVSENIEAIVENLENFYSTVYTKDGVSRRQYVIQRYNLGYSSMKEQTMKTGKTIYNRKNVGNNDEIVVKSLLMLPEPVIHFSTIELPGTSILDKSTLHQNYFMLFRFLRKKLDVQPHIIKDLVSELNYEKIEKDSGEDLFSNVHEFLLDPEEMLESDEKFHKFLEVIIPKTRFLVRIIKKYLKDKVSFIDVVKKLEPFMIYPSDISYKQYLEIRYLIKEQIQELKVDIEKRSSEFTILRNAKYNVIKKVNPILRLLSENKDFADALFQSYDFLSINKENSTVSNSEMLFRIIQSDDAILYTNTITSILISLITPNQLLDVLAEPKLDDLSDLEKIKPSDCARKYLAKRYTSIKDMQTDNSSDEVYFDKELDDTPYDIIKKYKKEKESMLPELFFEYLVKSLIDKHDCPKNMANDMAMTLIAGKRLVLDGEYAMLELKPTLPRGQEEAELSEKDKKAVEIEADVRKRTQYYRRIKGNWVKDNDIEEESFLDTSTLFCNISEKCLKNTSNSVCETTNDAGERMKLIAKKKMLNEFDKRYTVNVEELEGELEKNINYHLQMVKKLDNLRKIQLYRQSIVAYALGNSVDINESIQSPYLKLRELILGQDDFVKKQNDICLFVDKFCREPLVEQQSENAHWLYCKETNSKLFPHSIYELATSFVRDDDYMNKLNEVCHRIGILSDDGDSIVDKYSGFLLRKLDFATEEGFDEAGFRLVTNEIVEKDLGEVFLESEKKRDVRVFESETAEIIFNVFSTICRNIDIPIEAVEDFVMRMSRELFDKIIYTEAAYQKRSDKNFKDKGKYLQPYKNYRDETRIVIIACNILIAVQIAIPSLKTKRTLPGCIRSFGGYPLSSGVEDITGVQYLACVLKKTTSKISIWESIQSYKVETLVKRMRDIFENYILKRGDINELYVKKREYMLLNPDLIAPEEHTISKWRTFLPPLVDFNITKTLRNVASDFESDFKELMRKGSPQQQVSINVLKSKIIQFGYGVVETINDIVKKKDLILKTTSRIPFLENACCNESLNSTNPIVYFNEEDKNISVCIRSVMQLSRILKYAGEFSTAPFFYHSQFTGIRYSTISENNLDDADLIYAAVIHYCNFDKQLPIPEKFKIICNEKPAKYNPSWSIRDKIDFMKSNGQQYTVDNLHQIMKIINQENIVDVQSPEVFSKVNVMKDIIEQLDSEHSTIVCEPLRNLLTKVLDKYQSKCVSYDVSNELNDLQNYLLKANNDMYRQIIDFFGRYGNLSDRDYRKVHDFLSTICVWGSDKPMKETNSYYDKGLYSVTQFIQNSLQAICKIYPSILLNESGFFKNVPGHWGFSDKHNDIIAKFINQYYDKLEKFKEDRTLYRLLQEVGNRLVNLNTFLQNIPIFTEIVKDMGEDVEGERIRSFHCLLDKSTIYMLYTYCFYSALYEYIDCSNDINLLRFDIEELKTSKRKEIVKMGNVADSLTGQDIDYGVDVEDLEEVDVVAGNKEELKNRVAALLLCFLGVEQDNKDIIDLTYEQIIQKTRRIRDVEKAGVIERLGNMSIEERRVENDLKNYKIGRWNVGEQKGLYEYDKKTFDREIGEMIEAIDGDIMVGDAEGEDYDENLAEDNENIYDRGAVDIDELGEHFLDGAFYPEDQVDDFYPED